MIKTIFTAFFKNYIKIFAISFVALVVYTLLLYFIYPLTFTATASVLPPESPKSQGLAGLLGGQDLGGLVAGGATGNSQLYAEIVKSRSATEYVTKKIDLKDYYGSTNLTELHSKILGDLEVEVTKEGIIKVGFSVKTGYFGRNEGDRKKAADFSALISNTFVAALDSINRSKLHSKAKLTREFIEGRLATTKSDLDSAENSMAQFQKENKTISLPEQLKAAIDAAAKVKSDIIATQIELEFRMKTMSETSPEVEAVKSKLASLQKEYNKFQSNSDELFVGFKEAPALGVKLSNYYREVRVLSEVYSLLQQQYFKELIQEQKDIPTIEVLDSAVPPLRTSSPRMFQSVLAAAFLFFTLTFLYYFRKEDEVKRYFS